MNYADTEKIIRILKEAGWTRVPSLEEADLIILNSCSVRQRAEDKVLGLGRRITKAKEQNPRMTVVLTGCMSQRIQRNGCEETSDENYTKTVKKKMPWVDMILEIGDLSLLTEEILGEKKGVVYDDAYQSYLSSFSAFVPISKGCDNFCTYCVVPYTRGREIHRSYDKIIEQVEDLVNKGYSYITLLGQNVNSWKGVRNGKEIDFADLLEDVADIEGNYWLTFLTSHPKDFTEKLAKVLAHDRVCPYLNLPVQSGSDRILERMNRKYSRTDYLDKIDIVRRCVPDIRLSTDIIVGFPGESEEDFEDTLSLIEEVRYGMVYISEYSARPVAASYGFEDDVPQEVKKRRREALESLQREIIEEKNKLSIGQKRKMLITGNNTGMLQDLREVRVDGVTKNQVGSFIDVEIIDGTSAGLVATIAV